jgi:hypothetical protein
VSVSELAPTFPVPENSPPDFESTGEETIPPEILTQRICDFDLKLEGRPLGKLIESFQAELRARGITRLQPRFYLSDEWGVSEGTVAIGMPFYLADKRLMKVHGARRGLVEGSTPADILRYLRHEMGHVVNYGYRLYTTEEWTRLFGPMSRPYTEEYRSIAFSPDYVRHLPGNYAQKHPDEDWAETFAVWMTPELDWAALYADSPGALAKLEYCERTLKTVSERDPDVTAAEIDDDASELRLTVQEYYGRIEAGEATIPRSLDGDLQMIFAPRLSLQKDEESPRLGSAAQLIRRQADELANTVYLWTGVDQALTKSILSYLVRRADELQLTYPLGQRDQVLIQMSGFLNTLAMNYAYKGSFIAS